MSAEWEMDANSPPPMSRLCRYTSDRSSQPMVAVEGTEHVVFYLNPAFSQLVGIERNAIIGHPFAVAVPEGEANGCRALLDRVFRLGTSENLAEQEHRQSRRNPVYWSYAVWAMLGEDERPAGLMIQVTDSTENAVYRRLTRDMNEALFISATRQHELAEVAESLTARLHAGIQNRDHFLAVLSHELRNPLASLTSGAQLLNLSVMNAEAAELSRRAMMARQLSQMVRLVDDLLDVSRIATGKLELRKQRVDFASVVRDAVEASRSTIERGGHELTVTLPPDPVYLDADPTRLTQVFLNLLTNAAKYSEPGERIRLDTKRTEREIVVDIIDTGIGIAAKDLPHIFDAFVQVDNDWRRTQGGLGIGLSLVKEFVGLHGGQVEAHSAGLGKGSTFVVRLPLAEKLSAIACPPTDADDRPGVKLHILVIDDNRDSADSLAELLRLMDHEVRTAYDGAEALRILEKSRPDLILLDLGLPGMNGYEVASSVREIPGLQGVTIAAMTGWSQEEDRRRTREAGFDYHLVKPVDLADLEKVFGEVRKKKD